MDEDLIESSITRNKGRQALLMCKAQIKSYVLSVIFGDEYCCVPTRWGQFSRDTHQGEPGMSQYIPKCLLLIIIL